MSCLCAKCGHVLNSLGSMSSLNFCCCLHSMPPSTAFSIGSTSNQDRVLAAGEGCSPVTMYHADPIWPAVLSPLQMPFGAGKRRKRKKLSRSECARRKLKKKLLTKLLQVCSGCMQCSSQLGFNACSMSVKSKFVHVSLMKFCVIVILVWHLWAPKSNFSRVDLSHFKFMCLQLLFATCNCD